MDYSVHGILQARILEWIPSPGDLPNPEIEPRSPTLQADSLPAEPQGEPKNTGVGSLSLLQGIFPTQDSNHGLLHCRWILYQLSYQGSHKVCRRGYVSKNVNYYCKYQMYKLDLEKAEEPKYQIANICWIMKK